MSGSVWMFSDQIDDEDKLTALVEQKAPAVADEEGNRQ